jgi:hypothetical protein
MEGLVASTANVNLNEIVGFGVGSHDDEPPAW